MLTNSSSHSWIHHLLMLYGPLSPLLSPDLTFLYSLSHLLLLGPMHSNNESWVGGAAVAESGMCKCAFHMFHLCICVCVGLSTLHLRKNGIGLLNDGDADQGRGEKLLNGCVIDSQAWFQATGEGNTYLCVSYQGFLQKTCAKDCHKHYYKGVRFRLQIFNTVKYTQINTQ